MKITRTEAVEQVKKMVKLVDDIAATTIKNTVIGEEIRTNSRLGAKMIMAKYAHCTSTISFTRFFYAIFFLLFSKKHREVS